MSDLFELELEHAVRDLIVDLCEVMYRHGYHEISVGSLMRVIGVAGDRAAAHDSHMIDLHEHFANKKNTDKDSSRPPGTVLH